MMDIDALIIELIESGRRATDAELSHIVAHVAQAPFARGWFGHHIGGEKRWHDAGLQC